ncbi:hypothetical protein IN07_20815, partial [Modestobacter caceresii]
MTAGASARRSTATDLLADDAAAPDVEPTSTVAGDPASVPPGAAEPPSARVVPLPSRPPVPAATAPPAAVAPTAVASTAVAPNTTARLPAESVEDAAGPAGSDPQPAGAAEPADA